MKIKGREITIIENHPNEPWPRAVSIDGKRMDYNNRWENTAGGQVIYYKDPEDRSIFQGVGILRKDLLRVISSEEKSFRVKPEFFDAWFCGLSTEEIVDGIVTESEVERMAGEWGMSLDELLEQVEEA